MPIFCLLFPFSTALHQLININLLPSLFYTSLTRFIHSVQYSSKILIPTLPQCVSACFPSEAKARCVASPASAVFTLDFVQKRKPLLLLPIFCLCCPFSTTSTGLVNINLLPSLFLNFLGVQTYSYLLSPCQKIFCPRLTPPGSD